jgi:hypothetical protein
VTTEDHDDAGVVDRDDLIVAALATGASYTKTGEIVGCSRETVKRRMATREFRQRVVEARVAVADEALSAIEGITARAAERMLELVDAENEAVAFKAAAYVLDRAQTARETRSLAARVAELEQRLQAAQAPLRSAA